MNSLSVNNDMQQLPQLWFPEQEQRDIAKRIADTPQSRHRNTKQWVNHLTRYELMLFDVPRDGHCQFHALCYVFYGDSENKHMELRDAIANEIEANRDLNQYSMEQIDTDCSEFDDFVAKTRNGREWGNETTLLACADLYDVFICVLNNLPNSRPVKICPRSAREENMQDYARRGRLVHLAQIWNLKTRRPEHYQVVRVLSDKIAWLIPGVSTPFYLAKGDGTRYWTKTGTPNVQSHHVLGIPENASVILVFPSSIEIQKVEVAVLDKEIVIFEDKTFLRGDCTVVIPSKFVKRVCLHGRNEAKQGIIIYTANEVMFLPLIVHTGTRPEKLPRSDNLKLGDILHINEIQLVQFDEFGRTTMKKRFVDEARALLKLIDGEDLLEVVRPPLQDVLAMHFPTAMQSLMKQYVNAKLDGFFEDTKHQIIKLTAVVEDEFLKLFFEQLRDQLMEEDGKLEVWSYAILTEDRFLVPGRLGQRFCYFQTLLHDAGVNVKRVVYVEDDLDAVPSDSSIMKRLQFLSELSSEDLKLTKTYMNPCQLLIAGEHATCVSFEPMYDNGHEDVPAVIRVQLNVDAFREKKKPLRDAYEQGFAFRQSPDSSKHVYGSSSDQYSELTDRVNDLIPSVGSRKRSRADSLSTGEGQSSSGNRPAFQPPAEDANALGREPGLLELAQKAASDTSESDEDSLTRLREGTIYRLFGCLKLPSGVSTFDSLNSASIQCGQVEAYAPEVILEVEIDANDAKEYDKGESIRAQFLEYLSDFVSDCEGLEGWNARKHEYEEAEKMREVAKKAEEMRQLYE